MKRPKTDYNAKLKLECIENGKILEAELLEFKHAYSITCSVNRQIKVYLRYNAGSKTYLGRVGSLEFETKGPNEVNY